MLSNIFDNKILEAIESTLDKALSGFDCGLLTEAMRYSSLNGGKRIRPLFTIAAGNMQGASFDSLLQIGAAVELIHCYSLIHDDLPAMDDDDLRRGRPTCHKQYNEAIAILAGDALQAQAFAILSNDKLNLAPEAKLKIIHLLAISSGAGGMVGGQATDLLSTGVNLSLKELQQMHMQKTGALIKAAVLAGYLAGNDFCQNDYLQLTTASENIGLLFQITDDILDRTADTATLGKTANKDHAHNKATYVNILGLKQAQSLALSLYTETLKILEQLPESGQLTELTHFVYNRSN